MYRPINSYHYSRRSALFAAAVTVVFALAIPAAYALPIIGTGGGVGVGGGGTPAVGTPPLTLVSHTGMSSSTARAGTFAPDLESDSPASPLDPAVSTDASSGANVSGTGTGISVLSASASTRDSMSTAGGNNTFSFGYSTIFGPGVVAGDASARAEMSALWNLTFAVASMDLTYSVSRLLLGAGAGANGSGGLTVRNATTGIEILSLVDASTTPDTTLTIIGNVGDILEIAVSGFSAYDINGATAPLFNTRNYSLEFAAHAATVPEPLTTGLVIVGLLAMWRRHGALTNPAR